MNIRFYNAQIYTGQREQTQPLHGEVWVQNDTITLVGTPGEAVMPVWDREINCNRNLLIPGFKNAHAHSGDVALRSFSDDLPLQAWLDSLYPYEMKLQHEEIYQLTKLAILEYLSSGITTSFEMFYDREASARAAVDTGYRFVLTGGLTNGDPGAYIIEDQYRKYNHYHPRVSYQLGFHAEYSNSLKNLQDVAAIAQTLKAPVYAHNSETRTEVEGCLARYGKTPTELMLDLGIFQYGGGGYHCVHLSEHDDEIFRENGLYVVTNASSNLKLSSGIAPLQRYLEKGIPIAIGTDGAASNNCLDFFREMFLMSGLQKLESGAASMPAKEVLYSACNVGAHVMCIPECDTLAKGKKADIVMLNLHRPNMRPLHHTLENVVFSGSKENVMLTMVDGRILYENGQFSIGEDIEALYEKVEKIVDRVLN